MSGAVRDLTTHDLKHTYLNFGTNGRNNNDDNTNNTHGKRNI